MRSIPVKLSTITLGWLLIVLPLFDVITGFLIARGIIAEAGLASPSQLGRFVAIGLIIASMLAARMDARLLLLGAYPIVVELVAAALHQSREALLLGLVQAYKLSYLILLSVWLSIVLRHNDELVKVVRFVRVNLLVVSAMLFAALLFGLGVETYGSGGGVKGYFASGNALGIYLGGSLILMLSLRIHDGVRVSGLFTVTVLIAIVSIGTKTSVLMGFFVLLFWWIAAGCSMVWPGVAFAVGLVFADKIFTGILFIYQVVLLRWRNSEDLIHFLGSGRIGYVTDAFQVFFSQQTDLVRILIGAGASVSYQSFHNHVLFDTLETDAFDVFFMYGAVGALMYLCFFLIVAFRLRKRPALMAGFLLIASHSAVAGHILFNGMNALLLALYCGLSGVKRSEVQR